MRTTRWTEIVLVAMCGAATGADLRADEIAAPQPLQTLANHSTAIVVGACTADVETKSQIHELTFRIDDRLIGFKDVETVAIRIDPHRLLYEPIRHGRPVLLFFAAGEGDRLDAYHAINDDDVPGGLVRLVPILRKQIELAQSKADAADKTRDIKAFALTNLAAEDGSLIQWSAAFDIEQLARQQPDLLKLTADDVARIEKTAMQTGEPRTGFALAQMFTTMKSNRADAVWTRVIRDLELSDAGRYDLMAILLQREAVRTGLVEAAKTARDAATVARLVNALTVVRTADTVSNLKAVMAANPAAKEMARLFANRLTTEEREALDLAEPVKPVPENKSGA